MYSKRSPIVILQKVAEFREVTVIDLKSKDRTHPVVTARAQAAWLMREVTSLPLGTIGAHLGGRDHTSISSAISSVNRAIDADGVFASELAELRLLVECALHAEAGRTGSANRIEAAAKRASEAIAGSSEIYITMPAHELRALASAYHMASAQNALLAGFVEHVKSGLPKLNEQS